MKFPLRKITDFTMGKPFEVDEAYRKFFGSLPFDKLQIEWEELFLEWLIFDYKQKTGTSFIIEYILRNPDKLDYKTIDQFEQIAKTHIYSMFEIKEIYEENRANVLDFWQRLTNKGLTEKFLYEKPETLQDIWNYFPHKCLNDLSPIEVYIKMKAVR